MSEERGISKVNAVLLRSEKALGDLLGVDRNSEKKPENDSNWTTEELLCALYRVYHYTPEKNPQDRNFANVTDQNLNAIPYFNELANVQKPIKYMLRLGIAEALQSNDYNDTQKNAIGKFEKKFESLEVIFKQRVDRFGEDYQQDFDNLKSLFDPLAHNNHDYKWRQARHEELKHFITRVCLTLDEYQTYQKMQLLRVRFRELKEDLDKNKQPLQLIEEWGGDGLNNNNNRQGVEKQLEEAIVKRGEHANKNDQALGKVEEWINRGIPSYDNMGLDFWLLGLKFAVHGMSQDNQKIFKQFIWEATNAIPRRYSPLDDMAIQQNLGKEVAKNNRPLMNKRLAQSVEEIPENEIKSDTKEVCDDKTATLSSSVGERNDMTTCTNLHGFTSHEPLELNTLADILKSKTQSFDSRVACHWVALTRLKVNGDEQTRLIVANKGAIKYDENENKPKMLHDGGKTFTIAVTFDVMDNAPHYNVALFSSSYASKNNSAEIFNEEIKDDNVQWVLTINHKVATRMNAKDIENFLNAPTSGINNNSKSIAEAIRAEAYQRAHMDRNKDPIDHKSIDISVVVLPVIKKVNQVTLATFETFHPIDEADELNKVCEFKHQEQILLEAIELKSVEVLSDSDGIVLKEIEFSKEDQEAIDGYDHNKEKINAKLESLKKLVDRTQKKNLAVLHPELERFYNLVEKDIYRDKNLESLVDEVDMSVTFVLEAIKKNKDPIEHAAKLKVAMSYIQKLENKTSIHHQAQRVAKVILSVLAGLVVGALAATLLIATGAMPTAIVTALTVTGWVLTMALPLGLGAGSLMGYGIFGRPAEKRRRSGEKIHDELLTILEPVRVKSKNAGMV